MAVSAAPPPVFVDDTGRRRILTRRAVRIVVIGFTAYLGLLALGVARDPRVGPIQLPTFGLPGLALMTPPAPSVLGEQATRAAAGSQPSGGPSAPGSDDKAPPPAVTPAGTGSTVPGRPTVPSSAPAGRPEAPGTTTTSSKKAVPSMSPSSTSTTVPATSTTSSTTTSSTTTTSRPGQGPGQGPVDGSGYGSASAKGPDGSGAPGQERKSTTTTTAG